MKQPVGEEIFSFRQAIKQFAWSECPAPGLQIMPEKYQ